MTFCSLIKKKIAQCLQYLRNGHNQENLTSSRQQLQFIRTLADVRNKVALLVKVM